MKNLGVNRFDGPHFEVFLMIGKRLTDLNRQNGRA